MRTPRNAVLPGLWLSMFLACATQAETIASNTLAQTGSRLDATALSPSPAHIIFTPPRLRSPASLGKNPDYLSKTNAVRSGIAQTDLYSTVTNLWWEGPKTNILAIAEERLAANTNDIVGIVLKTEYDISFSRASVLSNSFRRVLAVGATVDTPAFAAAYPRIAWNVSGMFIVLFQETEESYQNDLPKGFILHKEMNMKWAWDALHEDGWLDVSPTNGPPSSP